MTIVILDRLPGGPQRYQDWLDDSGADLVLLTAQEATGVDARGYASVRPLPDYATSFEVERAVLALAKRTRITHLVAVAAADLVRAGALRDHLGLPGQCRRDALPFADPLATREVLRRAGVPTVPGGPVSRVSDLYWYAHQWGYPVRIRQRNEPGWPTVAELTNEADVRYYTRGGVAERIELTPSLLAEPLLPDAERVGVRAGVAADPEQSAVAAAAIGALPALPGHPYLVALVRRDGGWVVDSVSCDRLRPDEHRAAVRAQAGLTGEVDH
ncbi:hypothetical protein [Actinophytocola sp.]|uniref:hypothetical protein n=1 Tax=Actinophytocola sp. TaxID=1872138 RepID=UPI002D8095B1|nr:hypothetical protein [Actinophytocola sp.]HET9140735.1 hypothetical protein [Actinophytocola sp.]